MQYDSPSKSVSPQDMSISVRVGKSAIHGRGLFAVKAIAKGTEIGRCKVKSSSRPGPYSLWLSDGSDNSVDVICDFRFINHSEDPSVAIFEDLEVIALRDINIGEELTHDYDG